MSPRISPNPIPIRVGFGSILRRFRQQERTIRERFSELIGVVIWVHICSYLEKTRYLGMYACMQVYVCTTGLTSLTTCTGTAAALGGVCSSHPPSRAIQDHPRKSKTILLKYPLLVNYELSFTSPFLFNRSFSTILQSLSGCRPACLSARLPVYPSTKKTNYY